MGAVIIVVAPRGTSGALCIATAAARESPRRALAAVVSGYPILEVADGALFTARVTQAYVHVDVSPKVVVRLNTWCKLSGWASLAASSPATLHVLVRSRMTDFALACLDAEARLTLRRCDRQPREVRCKHQRQRQRRKRQVPWHREHLQRKWCTTNQQVPTGWSLPVGVPNGFAHRQLLHVRLLPLLLGLNLSLETSLVSECDEGLCLAGGTAASCPCWRW